MVHDAIEWTGHPVAGRGTARGGPQRCAARRGWLAVAGWVLLLLLAAAALAEAPAERVFVEGLRQRWLHELAAAHCQERLRRLAPDAVERADWTVELVRTLTEQAAFAPAAQRAALWQQAQHAAADFLQRTPAHPRAVLVRVQQALALLTQGEIGQQTWEAGLASPEELDETRRVLRQASGMLEQIEQFLRQEIPLRHRSPPRDGGLSAAALENLALQVQQQLARAQRQRGLLFPAGSDDRVALLASAAATLQSLRSRLADDHPLCSGVELDLAETLRLLSQPAQAAMHAQLWDDPAQPPAIRRRARTERIRLALAERQWPQLAALVDLEEPPGGPGWCELALARLEALLALQASARHLAAAEDSRSWQAQAAALSQVIASHCGSLAAQRASRLVAAVLPTVAGGNRQLLVTAAEGLKREGKLAQAAQTYAQAAQAAQAQGDLAAAFELTTQAAQLEQQQGQHRAAADRLRSLATSQPEHPRAATVHLAAAWNAAQEARQHPENLPAYESILHEHLARWPQSDSADQARLWLARLQLGRQQLDEAIATAAEVSPASAHYPAAMQLLADAWKQSLDRVSQNPSKEQVVSAIAFFRQALRGDGDRLPDRWTEADRIAALALADVILRFQPERAFEAEATLRAALDRSTGDVPETWLAAARARLAAAIAAQPGRADEAIGLIEGLKSSASDTLWNCLLLLDGLTKTAPAERQGELAGVMLEATKALLELKLQLPEARRPVLERIHAEALASAGYRNEGLAFLERLAEDHPEDGQIQESLARLWLASDEPTHWSKALSQWRLVATRSPPRSDRWFAAKYGVALAQFKLGQREEAAALLQYLLNVPPGMQGSPWEPVYRALLAQCETQQRVAPSRRGGQGQATPGPAGSKGPRGR